MNFRILVVKELGHIYNMDICLNIENINDLYMDKTLQFKEGSKDTGGMNHTVK